MTVRGREKVSHVVFVECLWWLERPPTADFVRGEILRFAFGRGACANVQAASACISGYNVKDPGVTIAAPGALQQINDAVALVNQYV